MPGALALVLHAHLPYVRHPEHRHSLEETWLYQAVVDSYLPLLERLERLVDDAVPFRLTLSLSPTLVSMLADPFLMGRCARHLDALCELGDREVARTARDARLAPLARFHRDHFRHLRERFERVHQRDLLPAFKQLAAAGALELITTSATHAFLPLLLAHPQAARAQIGVAVDAHQRCFGSAPVGFWLPECGYAPGLDRLLADEGLRYTFLETAGLLEGEPAPRFGAAAPVVSEAGLAVFARDPASSDQVWSAESGYPGHPLYREYHRDLGDEHGAAIGKVLRPAAGAAVTGFKYHRVTGREAKALYDPAAASDQARLHARQFVAQRIDQVRSLGEATAHSPVIVAPYDAELFGHWWFEGPLFLEEVCRVAACSSELRLRTPGDVLREDPVLQLVEPAVSSWGRGGAAQTWLNPRTDGLVARVDSTTTAFLRAVATGALAGGYLRQAARELLLGQASDWPFMVTAGTFEGYAEHRVDGHLAAVERLLNEREAGFLRERERRWPIFSSLDLGRFLQP